MDASELNMLGTVCTNHNLLCFFKKNLDLASKLELPNCVFLELHQNMFGAVCI